MHKVNSHEITAPLVTAASDRASTALASAASAALLVSAALVVLAASQAALFAKVAAFAAATFLLSNLRLRASHVCFIVLFFLEGVLAKFNPE
jgi:hypothetical protein